MASGYSELESAIETLIHKYYDYAKKGRKHDKMNKKEFKEILTQELSNVLTHTWIKESVEETFQALDKDKDGKMSFDEYWTLIEEIVLKMSQQMDEHKMPPSQTELERAIVTVLNWFFDHAREEGKTKTLSINKFIKLCHEELPHLTKDISLQEKMKALDINQDSELTFIDFWKLLSELSKQVKSEVKAKKK
ncbi:protein S100-A9-like [Anomaloglossus baeobatrachus]|uniref:protein S100-A9-like n=1 Tax=Anomaloglossus baeobatrachus TaxID=238106 RepID=UPI003F4FF426